MVRSRGRGWSALVVVAVACSGSNTTVGGPAGQTGNACSSAAACYPGLDAATVQGTVTCLTQVSGGYCTHTCQSDANCCSVPGECVSGLEEVCSPFESQNATYCLLSCSSAAIAASPNGGITDPTAYCQKFADPTFTCRSSGGGSNNQKFCGP